MSESTTTDDKVHADAIRKPRQNVMNVIDFRHPLLRCSYCGSTNHRASKCPIRPDDRW